MRLCQSVAICAYQKTLDPENEYLKISEGKAWNCLFLLKEINSNFAYYAFRSACSLEAHPYSKELIELLETNQDQIYPILNDDISSKPHMVFDLSIESLEFNPFEDLNDTKEVISYVYKSLKSSKKEIGMCRQNEVRLDYTKSLTNSFDSPTVHLGLDIFLFPKTPIYSPIEGTLVSKIQDKNSSNHNYIVILEHLFGNNNLRFFTLYKNLDEVTIKEIAIGKRFKKGELLGYAGRLENKKIPLFHVYFQVIIDLLGNMDNLPSVINASQKKIWLSLCPDPNIFLKIPQNTFPSKSMEKVF